MSKELVSHEKSNIAQFSDGFSKRRSEKRLIPGKLLKFVDGRKTVEGQPVGDITYLVMDINQVGQCFHDDGMPEHFFIDEENPISRIDELNNNIPKKDWKIGLSGEPEPRWKLNEVVQLLDEVTGTTFTMINSTVGMRIAVEHLCSQVEITRKLRGVPMLPIVKIGSTLMKTKFGVKSRPSFDVVGWKRLGDEHPLLKAAPAPTASEIVDDFIDF
jgi:hypothetical protein